jgi:hypothetical protein
VELRKRRFYGRDENDKAGILRYTKVIDELIDLREIPTPTNERELTWLLSYCWHVDRAYSTLQEFMDHRAEGSQPKGATLRALGEKYRDGLRRGLEFSAETDKLVRELGIS